MEEEEEEEEGCVRGGVLLRGGWGLDLGRNPIRDPMVIPPIGLCRRSLYSLVLCGASVGEVVGRWLDRERGEERGLGCGGRWSGWSLWCLGLVFRVEVLE